MQVQTCFGDKFVFVKVPSHVFLFSRSETMSLDTYTQNIPLTQKARYINIIKWGYFLKHMKTIFQSIDQNLFQILVELCCRPKG